MHHMTSQSESAPERRRCGPDPVATRIEERLRLHLDGAAAEEVCAALVNGQVVHLGGPGAGGLVAFKRGVLFIAGLEYVISDE
jgi:hypothetical protein